MNNTDSLKTAVHVNISVTVTLGTIGDYYKRDGLNELHKTFSDKAMAALTYALKDVDNIKITGVPKFKLIISDS